MNHNMIGDLILNDALELYGQPKWTFGKNTCNTYEVFVEKVHMPDGDVIPAWPVVELIERDEALTLLFSRWFLENAMRSACDLTEQTDSNVTLSMNLLPLYADRESFVDDVVAMLKKTGLKPQKMQFEVSEAQDLTERGIANLNALHDEHGIRPVAGQFRHGTFQCRSAARGALRRPGAGQILWGARART